MDNYLKRACLQLLLDDRHCPLPWAGDFYFNPVSSINVAYFGLGLMYRL